MKLVLTLVCGDEASAVDAQIAFHLHAGVDLVVVDHASTTGVADVLEAYAREGHVHLAREPGADTLPVSERVTRLARLAATGLGADWVINSDRGEFWWPRGGTLKEVLVAIPTRFGIVRALPRSFVPRAEDGLFFADRLTLRLSTVALAGASDATRSRLGIVHAARPQVTVDRDFALGESSLVPLRGWYPIEVLRLPVHGGEQPIEDEGALARGLEDGSLVVDARLRDVLRALRLPGRLPRAFALPSEREALSFPRPTVVDDAAYAIEVAALGEADETVLRRRLDEAERRIASLEQTVWVRTRRKLRRLLRRQ